MYDNPASALLADKFGQFETCMHLKIYVENEELRIKYIDANNILVQFIDTNAIVKTNYHHFKNGNVKDYLFKSKYGVGYIGLGKYKAGNGIHKNQYAKWKMMLERCYDPYEINKYPSYKDVIVCDEWLNYQIFA